MRSRRRPEALLVGAAFAALAAIAIVLARGSGGTSRPAPAFTWRGIVGDVRPPVSLGQRMVVVLRAPSLAQRLANVRTASRAQERRWTSQVYAAQHQVLTMLAAHGLGVHPDYTFARVLDGFSAPLDPRAVALLDDDPAVSGVYPVRAAFPATVSTSTPTGIAAPELSLPGFDGHGVEIALLDTGVDRSQPYLHGHVTAGIDVLDGGTSVGARQDPGDPSRREQHGTELAGLIVGENGPGGATGVAPGATILPIRVAGWQLDAAGQDVVYGRSDQLIAGLESAVDPNGDGDTHDRVPIALLGVVEPFAGFADTPEAQAVDGAAALGTLVVVPAGNDGIAGPGFGSISGPGGAAGALTVGASDGRVTTPAARVVLRRGLDVIYNARLPVLGTVAPTVSVNLQLGVPKTNGTAAPTGRDFYDAHGVSLVSGKAALVPAGEDPSDAAAAAAAAGARAVLVYGPAVPAGPLDLPTVVGVPVVGIPAGPALQLLAAFRLGVDVGVSLGAVHTAANPQGGLVAVFSSRGLSYDGRVKPNLVAPGVGLTTANAGTNAAGEPAFATVNGTSAAAASVAGAAALLLQARPTLDATSLKSLLVGYARLIPGASLAEQGGGTVDVGLSAAGEVVASPSSLPFGRWTGGAWRRQQQLTVRNISTRPLTIDLRSDAFDPGATVTVAPATVSLRPGVQTTVTVTASAAARATANLVAGEVVVAPRGSQPLHIAWAITFGALKPLLTKIVLHERSFAPSDAKPALLDLQIGQIVATGSVEIRPVDRLDIVLYDGAGKRLGLLARERALLPGTYRFALTGRGPDGRTLAPGAYALRLTAWRTVPAPVSTAVVRFRIT